MKATLNIDSVTMPAGAYYVGDPCYAFSNDNNERWMQWLKDANYDVTPYPRYLLAEVEGKAVLGIGTAYGDGAYPGSDGFEYCVDAGLLGVVPVEVAEDSALYAMNKTTFDKPFTCSYDEGTITLGHIVIETSDESNDDWDWNYDENDESDF